MEKNLTRKDVDVSNGYLNIFKKLFFTLSLTFFFGAISVNFLYAQQNNSIAGKVTNSSGEPLPGVTIVIKGTNDGTVTDVNGKYFLSNISDDAILQFSFVGMKVQEVVVGSQTAIDLKMVEDAIGLEEVVAVGYGTQSKRNVTGAISKINMEMTENLPNTNVTQSLRGRVAGVQFTDNGRPGQNGTILIRGPRSLSASNNPLIVLDGTIYNGVISDINPNDISSMDVLKDASASAIYGSRAANGVILITSKKGISEKPVIRFNYMGGVSSPSYKIKLLTPERYIQKVLDFRREAGLEVNFDNIADYLAPNEAENYNAGITIDPWDFATQDDAGQNQVDINISGKSKNTNYYISSAYSNEKGIILNDNQEKLTFRINLENEINKSLKIGIQSLYARRNFSGAKASLNAFYQTSPYGSLYNDDGTPREYVVDGENVAGNALYYPYYNTIENIQNNLFANLYADITVPFIDGLSYKLSASPNIRWNHSYSYRRQDLSLASNMKSASKSLTNYYNWLIENIVSYKKEIALNHFLDLTLLYSRENSSSESTSANSSLMSSDVLGWNNLGLGETQTIASGGSGVQGVSYMARLNYRMYDKYLFTFTVRRDGSSVFSENNKYATFPSGAFSWIVSDENFMKSHRWIDVMKLRLSYGAVGNQAISPYQSLSLLNTGRYVFGDNATSVLTYYPANMSNSDLKWETTYTTNIGLDFEFLKNRIGGTIEWYNMDTKDLLVQRSLPRMTGFTSIWTNLGQVNNRGLELTLNTINLKKRNFEWSSNLTFSANRNKIVHLYRSDTDGDGKEDDDLGNNWFIGQPITVYYDYVLDGIYQEGDEMPIGYKPGYIKTKDLDKGGEIDSNDRTIIGQGAQPKYRWGINNTFIYKNFTLSVFVNAMQGWISPFTLVGRGPVERSLNFIDYGWWTPENKSNTRPSLMHENKYNQLTYISRDFVRIQDVSLTYDFPKEILEKVNLSSLRLVLSGKNLYTFTDWIGADPESGTTDRSELYPMPRTIAFGVNVGF